MPANRGQHPANKEDETEQLQELLIINLRLIRYLMSCYLEIDTAKNCNRNSLGRVSTVATLSLLHNSLVMTRMQPPPGKFHLPRLGF